MFIYTSHKIHIYCTYLCSQCIQFHLQYFNYIVQDIQVGSILLWHVYISVLSVTNTHAHTQAWTKQQQQQHTHSESSKNSHMNIQKHWTCWHWAKRRYTAALTAQYTLSPTLTHTHTHLWVCLMPAHLLAFIKMADSWELVFFPSRFLHT